MASYRASATGNWSNLGIWQVWNGSAWVAAVNLPGSADDVWSNTFTVTIDQNITVLTLRNVANTTPAVTAGGGFIVSGTGLSITCIQSLGLIQNNTVSNLLTISGTGNNTFNINILGVSGGSTFNCVRVNSTGIVNWVGSVSSTAPTTTGAININNNCIFNIIGDIFHNGTGSTTVCISTSINSTGATLNITGNIGKSTGGTTTCVIFLNANNTLNIIGNVISSDVSSNQTCILVNGGSDQVINITGNVIGGTLSSCIVSSSVSVYLKIIGLISTGNSATAINFGTTNSVLITTGPLISSDYGRLPYIGSRMCLINPSTTYYEYADDSQNGNTTGPLPNRFTLYSPDTIADSPIPANVRQGTIYALGSQTGTLAVPSPSDVRKGFPTDNTVGTADLTAEDILDAISISTNDVAVRLRNVSTVASTGAQIASYKV
jgi:hypothetical protein